MSHHAIHKLNPETWAIIFPDGKTLVKGVGIGALKFNSKQVTFESRNKAINEANELLNYPDDYFVGKYTSCDVVKRDSDGDYIESSATTVYKRTIDFSKYYVNQHGEVVRASPKSFTDISKGVYWTHARSNGFTFPTSYEWFANNHRVATFSELRAWIISETTLTNK